MAWFLAQVVIDPLLGRETIPLFLTLQYMNDGLGPETLFRRILNPFGAGMQQLQRPIRIPRLNGNTQGTASQGAISHVTGLVRFPHERFQ